MSMKLTGKLNRDKSRRLEAKKKTIMRFQERYKAKHLRATFDDYMDYLSCNDWKRYVEMLIFTTGQGEHFNNYVNS